MLPLKRTAIALTLLLCTATAVAATPADFYVDLLQKGIAQYNAAEYDKAVDLLRVAAFGLLDATDRYQTAQIYRAIAADKLNDVATTRDAARRLLAAERVQRTYSSLTLPAPVRATFESVAKKVLAPSEVSILTSGPSASPVQRPQSATTTPAQTAQNKPAQQQSKPAQQQQQQQTVPPRSKTTQPQTTTPPPQQQAAKPETKVTETKVTEAKVAETKVAETKPASKPEAKPAQKPAETAPREVAPQPRQTPAQTQVARNDPPRTETPAQTTTAATTKPATTQPAPAPTTTAALQPRDLTQPLAAADRALTSGNLTEARRLYRQLLEGTLTHEQAIQIAEGLYRARDFVTVLRAFDHIGTLRRGEEPYRFYLAVALYESGLYAAAKKELDAVLNYIEVTPDVARYRDKIQSAASASTRP